MKEKLKQWEAETQELVEAFADYYFGSERELWWVSDEVGGVVFINDFWFSLSDIVDFVRFGYSKTDMFKYYDYAMECAEEKSRPINIKTYALGRELKKKRG